MEILVADDGSTDSTVAAVESIQSEKVRIERFTTPVGISCATNHLLSLAKGRYLARMDADDICHRDRFRLQVDKFRNSDLAVLGTWARRIGRATTIHRDPTSHDDILAKMAICSPFVNPTVMFDRERLDGLPLLDPDLAYASDYALFVSLRGRARMGNIPRILLDWRLHCSNVGSSNQTKVAQHSVANKVRSDLWRQSGVDLDQAELLAIQQMVHLPVPRREELHLILSSFRKALRHPQEDRLWAPRPAIRKLAGEVWDYCCKVRAWGTPSTIPLWLDGRRRLSLRPGPKTLLILALKSLVRASSMHRD